MAASASADHLAELLTNYAALHDGRRLWLTISPRQDSWELLLRVALIGLGADWLAVLDKIGQTWVITDAVVMADCKRTARELPSAAPGLVRMWFRELPSEAFELSAGWTAAVKRMAELMEAISPESEEWMGGSP